MSDTNTDPTQNPDFIALEMDDAPSALPTADDDSDIAALDAPSALSTLAADLAAISAEGSANAAGAVSGSLQDGTMRGVGFSAAQGYVTALANGVKAATAESYKRTLASQYGFTPDQIAGLTVTLIADGVSSGALVADGGPLVVTHDGPNVFQQRRIAAGLSPTARMAPVTHNIATAPVAPPAIDRGILPRTEILRRMAEESPGTLITVARAQRRSTHQARSVIVNALVGTEFADWAPRIKSNKRQFGEVMRSLNSQEFRAWAINRGDMVKTGQEWPESLEARWCMGALDGSDSLGSLGEKVLVADLLDNGEIRFNGGTDVLRAKVTDAFVARCGDQTMTATDLLTWFRDKVLPEQFHAFDCAGAIYVPGNPDRLESFLALVSPFMSRRITLWDMVSGKKLSDSLMQGLIQMLDEIDADYGTDCEKAREREQNKVRKQNESHTQADLDLASARAVVLPERAGTYLRRIEDCQAYLDGLKKLLGDDTAPIVARMTAIRATIEPLCNDTSRMAANIDFTPSTVVAEDAPRGPSLLELD